MFLYHFLHILWKHVLIWSLLKDEGMLLNYFEAFKRNARFVQKETFEPWWISNQTIMDVRNITEAAAFKGTLMQIWKSAIIFIFIWKYVEDFTLKDLLLCEICAREICQKSCLQTFRNNRIC